MGHPWVQAAGQVRGARHHGTAVGPARGVLPHRHHLPPAHRQQWVSHTPIFAALCRRFTSVEEEINACLSPIGISENVILIHLNLTSCFPYQL